MSERKSRGCRRARPRRARVLVAPALVVAAVALAACGSDSGETVRAAGAPKLTTADLPKPLARNVRQANVILDGPGNLLQRKLDQLRGFPIVVNQWASWCEPCRFEFPFFQTAARKHRATVAFLGLDMRDSKGDAKRFLEEVRAPFPSIFDPDASFITSLGGGRASPTTVFLDTKGEVVSVHPGAYASADALERDIQRFARPGGSKESQ